ncbi:helix-turn-helix transcriptional regulator [Streptomyces sp. DSM 44915]|uniref:Helix-turn-helix transcriptional regulator n=1 Tax=Streptomyces chisholmiae TaxID=3075540 RepID=A0ABU2JZ64_9ACTN|nr:helix-turn-helix transcriptional regulator [Streptomyces sp. DSM 44915]MDT0270300.1 helix-turn-helix transcriptional regulator [Streptomyces sp. DSM 44915]
MTTDTGTRGELADFLRSRRDRTRPEDHGLPVGRRRAPGLRRAEVAQLAGISVDYYIRLEQGKAARPSPTVLDALARTMRLSADEREHLYLLARAGSPRRRIMVDRVRPGVRQLLGVLEGTPAYVMGRRMDILAWNGAGAALLAEDYLAEPRPPQNFLLFTFGSPRARTLLVDWEAEARQGIAQLRVSAGHYPDDPGITAMVGELSVKSHEFRTWWARHDVQDRGSGRKEFDHPLVGRLSLDYESLRLSDGIDQRLVVYTAPAGGRSVRALERLGAVVREAREARQARQEQEHQRLDEPGSP